jgi:hypothetical protein
VAELITLESLGPVLDKLRLAFRVRLTERDVVPTVEVWLDGLTGLTVESVQTAARRHIQTGEHFPRVKELRELALEFMGRTQAGHPERRPGTHPLACSICGAKPEPVIVTRPMRNPREQYAIILDLENKPVMETVDTGHTEIYHDRAAHHLVDSLTG